MSSSEIIEIITILGTAGVGAGLWKFITYFTELKKASQRTEAEQFYAEYKSLEELNDKQRDYLNNHSLFTYIDSVSAELREIYLRSNKGIPQKLFIYQMLEMAHEMKEITERDKKDLLTKKSYTKIELVNRITRNMNKSVEIVNCRMENVKLPKGLIDKFFVWFSRNWNWYSEPCEKILLMQRGTFNIINTHFIRTIDLISAILADIKANIDRYNGEVTEYAIYVHFDTIYKKYKFLEDDDIIE